MSGIPVASSRGMAVRAALLLVLVMGCVVTETGEFPLEENHPASIRSHSAAEYPLGRIHVLELSEEPTPEILLDVIVSTRNVEDDLEAIVLVDTVEEQRRYTSIPAEGTVDRRVEVDFDDSDLLVPGCHRVELQVSTLFVPLPPAGVPLVPAEETDLGSAVWWFFTRDDPTTTFDPAQCPIRTRPERPE